jgi:hypothetical protein
MKLSKNSLVLTAALTGLLGGTMTRVNANPAPSPDQSQDAGKKAQGKKGEAAAEKHACAGQNSCKGQGGCATDGSKDNKGATAGIAEKHSCAGKNSCKGNGGCATDGSAKKKQ